MGWRCGGRVGRRGGGAAGGGGGEGGEDEAKAIERMREAWAEGPGTGIVLSCDIAYKIPTNIFLVALSCTRAESAAPSRSLGLLSSSVSPPFPAPLFLSPILCFSFPPPPSPARSLALAKNDSGAPPHKPTARKHYLCPIPACQTPSPYSPPPAQPPPTRSCPRQAGSPSYLAATAAIAATGSGQQEETDKAIKTPPRLSQ